MTRITPAKAWAEMARGNERFVSGAPAHPRQDVDRRAELVDEQRPTSALFGCSDSRLAAEIIFDKGLGDLFVVRNAGQIISDSVVGSLEYAVGVLEVPLIVVLGHDNCGAVNGAINTIITTNAAGAHGAGQETVAKDTKDRGPKDLGGLGRGRKIWGSGEGQDHRA